MKKDCSECPYCKIDEFGDSCCNYYNINPAGICVYDIIEEENKEYNFENIERKRK